MASPGLTKKYDVISVSHYFYPRVGGLEKMAYTVLSELATQGYKCLALHGNGVNSHYQINGFDCQSFNPFKIFAGTYPVFGIRFALFLMRVLKRNPQAVVLVYDRHLTSSFITGLICKLMGHKYVLISQTTNSNFFRHKFYETLANFLDMHAFKYVVAWADKIVAVSEANRDFVIERYQQDPAKFVVIYNGFNQELVDKFMGQRKEKIVVFSAKWIQVKDPDTVAKAYLQLAQKYADWQFVFAGEGDCLISDVENLPENIKLIPRFLTQLELFELFGKSAIYINASLHEGLAISIVEAAALGNMLVLSDAPSNVELSKELGVNGESFTRSNPSELTVLLEQKIAMFETLAGDSEVELVKANAHQKFPNRNLLNRYVELVNNSYQHSEKAQAIPALAAAVK